MVCKGEIISKEEENAFAKWEAVAEWSSLTTLQSIAETASFPILKIVII